MKAADWNAALVEAALVFCSNVVFWQVGVEIVGDIFEAPTAFGKFFNRPVEKFAAVGFEVNGAIVGENVVVNVQEGVVGQAAFGVTVLWPWVGKMQIDVTDFSWRKDFVEVFGVQPEKTHLFRGAGFFSVIIDGVHDDFRHHIDAEKVQFRVALGGCVEPAATA